jgi:tetratricopeptide (TPR) repeat protein
MAFVLEKLPQPEREAALRENQAAVTHFEKLGQEFPEETNYRENAAYRSHDVARLARATNHAKEEVQAWCKAIEIWKKMAADFPTRKPAYLRQQVVATYNLGQHYMASKNYSAAKKAYHEMLAINERLVTEFHAQPGDRFNKAWDLSHLSEAYEAAGQVAEARKYLEQSVEEFRRLTDDFRKDLRYRNDLRSRRAELLRLFSKPRR